MTITRDRLGEEAAALAPQTRSMPGELSQLRQELQRLLTILRFGNNETLRLDELQGLRLRAKGFLDAHRRQLARADAAWLGTAIDDIHHATLARRD
jgi:hypothetical protein